MGKVATWTSSRLKIKLFTPKALMLIFKFMMDHRPKWSINLRKVTKGDLWSKHLISLRWRARQTPTLLARIHLVNKLWYLDMAKEWISSDIPVNT